MNTFSIYTHWHARTQAYVRTYTPTRINIIRRQQKCSKRETKEEKSFFPFFFAKHADSSAWLLPQSEIIFLARCCVRNLRCPRSTRRSIHVFHSLFAPPQQKWNLYSKTRTQSGGGGTFHPGFRRPLITRRDSRDLLKHLPEYFMSSEPMTKILSSNLCSHTYWLSGGESDCWPAEGRVVWTTLSGRMRSEAVTSCSILLKLV